MKSGWKRALSTDAAIAKFASEYLVLTDDARFVVHLNEMGLDALNINHIRQEVWLRDQEAVS